MFCLSEEEIFKLQNVWMIKNFTLTLHAERIQI